MAGTLAKNWPAYLFVGVFICFFIYVVIKGNLQERKKEGGQDKGQDNKKAKRK